MSSPRPFLARLAAATLFVLGCSSSDDALAPLSGGDAASASDSGGSDAGLSDAGALDAASLDSGPDNSVITATLGVDLYVFKTWGTASGISEISVLSGADNYQTFKLKDHGFFVPSNPQGSLEMVAGDFDADKKIDLFIVGRENTNTKVTETHVMDGASTYAKILLAVPTAFAYTGLDRTWQYRAGDYNKDGKPDLYGILSNRTGSGKLEVHIVDGANNLASFIEHTATSLDETIDAAHAPFYGLADFNADGSPDLYVILTSGTASSKTEVVVLDGSKKFSSELARDATSIPTLVADGKTTFSVADANGDGVADLFMILRAGTGSGFTEITVLNGADHFKSVLRRGPTALPTTVNGTSGWGFDLGHP